MAKTIGNVAKVLGPVLSVITIAIEVANAYQESQQEQQLADARRSVVTDFQKMAEGLEAQFRAQCREVETALHDKLEADIRVARAEEEAAIASSNAEVARLSEMRSELETLLDEVAQESVMPA